MGWCHEFGPQIHEGCDHPMVAGATSCTCEVCGSECTGKFSGCADVWARGPRLVAPRVRANTAGDVGGQGDSGGGNASPGSVATQASVLDEDVQSMLRHLVQRCDALEESQGAGPSEGGISPVITAELAALGRRLETLSSSVQSLEASPAMSPPEIDDSLQETVNRVVARLVGRVNALEEQGAAEPGPTEPAPGVAPDELAEVAKRVAALEQAPPVEPEQGVAPDELAEVAKRVAALEQTPPVEPEQGVSPGELAEVAKRVAALEQTPPVEPEPGVSPGELAEVAKRVAALEKTPPVEPAIPVDLANQLEGLVAQVAALEQAQAGVGDTLAGVPAQLEAAALPATTRIQALEGVLAGAVQSMGRLSSRVSGLDELPKRVETLEHQPVPSEKLVASLAKRIDRLSTQLAALKEVPERIKALEEPRPLPAPVDEQARAGVDAVTAELGELTTQVNQLRVVLEALVPRLVEVESAQVTASQREQDVPPDRTNALAGGLGHAIDMIDQLAHQVAILEQAVGTARADG